MRNAYYLLLLGLSSCTLLITRPGSLECDEGSPSRCEGNTLVVCIDSVELRQDCADLLCQKESDSCVGVVETCGNGTVDAGEQCDDGNNASGDGCSAACTTEGGVDCGNGVVEAGEQCDDENNVNTDICLNNCQNARCGDSVIRTGFEQCDDGNQTNGDGCNSACQTEGAAVCGNGVTEAGEQCDDDNGSNTDACTNVCRNARCGDGFTRTGFEQCDDGNTNNNDSCSNSCTLNNALCGNGVVNSGEECDDGNTVNGDLSSDFCDSNCTEPACGNGVLGVSNFGGLPFPFPESCDDGNLTNGDGCDSQCFTETTAVCGNGTVEAGEQCDDGDTFSGDGCSSTCQTEGGNEDGTCQFPFTGFGGANTGSTAGPLNISDGSCQTSVQGGGLGGDVVFRLTAGASGTIDFTLSSNNDMGIFIESACPGTELACADVDFEANHPGTPESETIQNFSVSSGQTIFIFVGAFSPTSEGPFTLTIQ